MMSRTIRWCAAITLVISGVLAGLGTTQAPGADPLAQECSAAALEKPAGVKVSIRHAGHNSGKHQAAVLTAQYKAMPKPCIGNYRRGNHAKAQVFRNGRWSNINDWEWVSGGTWTPGEGTSSYIDNQMAFTGLYYGLPLVTADDEPNLYNPCRVRILLKENVTRPEPHPTDRYNSVSNIAQRIYAFPVPLSRIRPHRGQSCKLLSMRRYGV